MLPPRITPHTSATPSIYDMRTTAMQANVGVGPSFSAEVPEIVANERVVVGNGNALWRMGSSVLRVRFFLPHHISSNSLTGIASVFLRSVSVFSEVCTWSDKTMQCGP